MGNIVTDIVIWAIVVIALIGLVTLVVLRWRARPLKGDAVDPRSDADRPDQRGRPGAEYRPIADAKASGGGGLGI
ncbi:hypothetical protein [Microbacterium sp. ZW T5_56]|uniref:hypothetical protein n=1 Tax=Microbacterium sp. ZW T5_56 TaxID=3378081 RepID=UPI003854A1B5